MRNDSRFVLWIQRAVRDGDSNAQTYLGSYLLEGIENVLPQDVTHGIQLLEQAVLQENADAMLILGRWLVEQNDGRPEQQQRGFALLQKAESAGNPDALCEVGCCLLYGVGTPANQKLGLEKLRQAAEAGISVAQEVLGTFLIHTNVEKAEDVRKQGVYWLTKAAEEGSLSAQRELGCGYLYNGDIEVNFSEAEKWLTRAVEGGDMESCASLAYLYLEGQTARSSLKKAARVLQLGTERGDHMCMTLLACFYQDGICVPKDPEKAFAMFQEASSDEMSARFHVAECYLSGSGVEKDEAFALQWYREIRKSLPIDNILINECHVMDGISDTSKKRVCTTCVWLCPPDRTVRPVMTSCLRPESRLSIRMASASLLGLPRICPSITTMVSAEMMISSSAQSFATALAFSALTRATSCSGGSDGSICSSMSAVCTVNSSPRSFRSSCRRGDLDAKIMDIKTLPYSTPLE